jgi:hypothetical protein
MRQNGMDMENHCDCEYCVHERLGTGRSRFAGLALIAVMAGGVLFWRYVLSLLF